jgi:hypothetical protein
MITSWTIGISISRSKTTRVILLMSSGARRSLCPCPRQHDQGFADHGHSHVR